MSLFLLYFDDGPLDQCAGRRGSLALVASPAVVVHGKDTLARRVVVLSDGVSSESFRLGESRRADELRREVTRFMLERLVAGFSPKLLFHVVSSASVETVRVVNRIDVAVSDVWVQVTRDRTGARGKPGAVVGGALGQPTSTIAEGAHGPLFAILREAPDDVVIAVDRIRAGPRTRPRGRSA